MQRKQSGYSIEATALDNTSDLLVLYFCSSIGKPPRYEFTRKRPRQSTENVDLQRGPDCPAPHEPLLWGNFLATYLPYRFVEYIRISSTSNPMFPWAGNHGSGFCPQREEPSSDLANIGVAIAAFLATSVSKLWRITGKTEQTTDYDLHSLLCGLQTLLPSIV